MHSRIGLLLSNSITSSVSNDRFFVSRSLSKWSHSSTLTTLTFYGYVFNIFSLHLRVTSCELLFCRCHGKSRCQRERLVSPPLRSKAGGGRVFQERNLTFLNKFNHCCCLETLVIKLFLHFCGQTPATKNY